MHITRRPTRQIQVGKVKIGGDAPVSVQSMCSTDTRDVTTTVEQIRQLEAAGCELIRVAVPDEEAAAALPRIKAAMTVPLIADIHFDHRLALKAAEIVDCVRINPGNIGAWWKVEEVIKAVNGRGIPLRVGVNGGSLERPLLDKYGWPSPEALSESALNAVHALEDVGFTNMKVSLKASDVHHAIDAYWLFAHQSNYPLHIGITEAGTAMTGAVKSAMGLGYLLSQGIGDTLRVSLAADPVEEVKVGFEILKSLELRHRGINVIACPTCGRVEIDVVRMKLYSDSVWFWRISEGVPNTKMKAWKSKLSDEDRWKLVLFERNFGLKDKKWDDGKKEWADAGNLAVAKAEAGK